MKIGKIENNKSNKLTYNQVGFPAINFSANDFISGKPVDLEFYKGKFLFLEFWGTWYGPCIKEMPKLKTLYSKLDHNNIEFSGIVQNL